MNTSGIGKGIGGSGMPGRTQPPCVPRAGAYLFSTLPLRSTLPTARDSGVSRL